MKKECNGNLKDIILEMMKSDTDCCEVTNTVGDTSVTVEVMITNFINENSLKGMQNMKVVMNYLKETIPNQYDNQFAVRCIREKLI